MNFGKLGARGGFGSLGVLGRSGNSGPPSGISNFNQAFLSQWRSSSALVAAGTSDVLINCGPGDSTTAGSFSSSKTSTYPNVLANLLTAAGINSSNEGFFATHGYLSPINFSDANLSVGSGWNVATSQFVYAGRCFASSDTTLLSYTPYNTVDTWDIGYVAYGSGGSFSVGIDGGAPITTINAVNASTLVSVATVTVPSGTHRLDITQVTAGPVLILYAIGRVAAQKRVKIYNGGSSGATVAFYTGGGASTFNPVPMLKTLAPKLSLICLTINDWNAATNTATYTAGLQSLISAAQLSGDVVLVCGAPSQTTVSSVAQQAIYRSIVQSLALLNNCVLLDLTTRWGSWAAANTLGWYANNLHPNDLGYADFGAATAAILIPAANSAAVPTIFNNGFKGSTVALSNGGLTATVGTSANTEVARSIVSNSTGKYYAEFKVVAAANPGNNTLGIINGTGSLEQYVGRDLNSIGVDVGTGAVFINAASVATVSSSVVGDTICTAVDLTNGKIWFRTNGGNWNNNGTANPATNTGGISLSTLNAGPYFAGVAMATNTDSFTANFGATPYANAAPSGFGNWIA